LHLAPVPGAEKDILFCVFARFHAFLRLQALVWQKLAGRKSFPKKSCRKTYGRFFWFLDMWQNRRVNMKKVQAERRVQRRLLAHGASDLQSDLNPGISDLIRPNGKKKL
jgi:hypothetical protein